MPTNNGVYSLPPIYQAVPGTTIEAVQHNAPLQDLAMAMNGTVTRDGSRPFTANVTMGGNRITGLGTPTNAADAVRFDQLAPISGSVTTVNARVTSALTAIEAAVNLAVPVGMVAWHNGARASIPAGWLPSDGQSLVRATYLDLWTWANAQSPATDAAWLASAAVRARYSTGNGSTSFRMPDLNGKQASSLRGLFLRGDGRADAIGTILGDAIRNLTGTFNGGEGTSATDSGIITSLGNTGGRQSGTDFRQLKYQIDASNQVPTADENRPVSAVGVWIVRSAKISLSGI